VGALVGDEGHGKKKGGRPARDNHGVLGKKGESVWPCA